MVFPPWIERKPRSERASARLKFMINQAALIRFGRTSIRQVAEAADLSHASVFNAINRGSCTDKMADALVQVLQHPQVTREALINPMAVVLAEETQQ